MTQETLMCTELGSLRPHCERPHTSLRSGSVSGLEVSVVVEELSSSARASFSSSSCGFPFPLFSFSSCFFGGLALRCWRDFPFPLLFDIGDGGCSVNTSRGEESWWSKSLSMASMRLVMSESSELCRVVLARSGWEGCVRGAGDSLSGGGSWC